MYMTIQYYVQIKVLNMKTEYMIQHALKNYRVFTDESGNLSGTCFSRENLPYVGSIVVVKTIRKEAADTAHEVLSGIEGLIVLPITECNLEEDEERIKAILEARR